jgi:NAD(P)-dependent dehydrogenase (short-subunit alcohol dehydrogenase family)
MDFQLHDRVVVITGAGSGIGLATTQTFLGEGAKVVAADLDPSAAGELSDNVTALKVDMSTPDGAGFAVAETMRAFGRVDVLVNNVGAFPFRESFLAVSDAEWNELMNLNFYSAVRACRAVLPHMVEQRARRNSIRGLRRGTCPRPILRRLQRLQGRDIDDLKGAQHRIRSCWSSLQLCLAGPDANTGVGPTGWLRRLTGNGIQPRQRSGYRSFRQGGSKIAAAEAR